MKISVNLTNFFDCVKAEAQDYTVLILRKLDVSIKRFDGKKAQYQLEHRWLSHKVKNISDENWNCVNGSEFTYWTKNEIKPILKDNDNLNALFDFFQLF